MNNEQNTSTHDILRNQSEDQQSSEIHEKILSSNNTICIKQTHGIFF